MVGAARRLTDQQVGTCVEEDEVGLEVAADELAEEGWDRVLPVIGSGAVPRTAAQGFLQQGEQEGGCGHRELQGRGELGRRVGFRGGS